MHIIDRAQIVSALRDLDLIAEIEAGFVAYSNGRATIPPVGELLLDRGEVHIKYGYLHGDESYVIKIASGFYRNTELGLPTSNGLMLVFSQRTGVLQSILLDEGLLTDVRTAVAGAIAAKYLAPKKVRRIGIIGTGTQARLQLQHLRAVCDCRQVLVWGRRLKNSKAYCADMQNEGFDVQVAEDVAEIPRQCNLIVTTTPARVPLVDAENLQAGTHITAVGADVADKQELAAAVLARADLVVADSLSQCRERGEIRHALAAALIDADSIVELGQVIAGASQGRTGDEQITIADLTGVAVQDIKIAQRVVSALAQRKLSS